MKFKLLAVKIFLILSVVNIKVSGQSTGFINPTSTALPSGFSNAVYGMVSDTLWATLENLSNCRCPYLYLSWDGGATYTSVVENTGQFDTMDTWRMVGSPTDTWGHNWVDSEFSNSNFRLKIANPSQTVFQGYSTFNFNIPTGAIINGIEVNVQFHGDPLFTIDYLNALLVDVFYTSIEGIPSVISLSNKINLFPNPAYDKLTLTMNGISDLSYSLFSIDGKMIIEKNIGTINSDVSTDIMLNNIPSGIYILRLISKEEVEYRKIVIQ